MRVLALRHDVSSLDALLVRDFLYDDLALPAPFRERGAPRRPERGRFGARLYRDGREPFVENDYERSVTFQHRDSVLHRIDNVLRVVIQRVDEFRAGIARIGREGKGIFEVARGPLH